jgi:hypothetical protein
VTGSGRRTQVAAVVCSLAAVLSVSVTVGAARERSALPRAAQVLLQATIDASALSGCLQGTRDDLFAPGARGSHARVAVDSALRRLSTCDVDTLAGRLDEVRLPAPAAVTDDRRRRAHDDIVSAVALLRRVVLDARGARTAVARQARGAADGTAVALAYRSAESGSDAAYALVEEALALLGHPQSTVN